MMQPLSALEFPALLSHLAGWYGLGELRDARPLRGGEWNAVYRVEAEAGLLVLRIAHPATAAGSLAYSHRVMRGMSRFLPEVAAPLAAASGATVHPFAGRLMALFPYVPGSPARAEEDATLARAAELLARLHRTGLELATPAHPVFHSFRDMDWAENALWSWQQVGPFLAHPDPAPDHRSPQTREALRAFRAALQQQRLDLAAELSGFRDRILGLAASDRPPVEGIIHGDYYPDNLLQEAERITGVIDWDETRPQWLVYELARATWEFCHAEGMLDHSRARCFLQAYFQGGGPVSEAELDRLTPFIRYTRLEDTLFDLNEALRGGAWDAEYTEYHLENLAAMQRLRDAPLCG